MALCSDFDEDLIQVPLPLRAAPHEFGQAFPDLVRQVSPEPIDPEADTFVTDINAALVEKIFDISKRERKSDVHQHAKLDDFGRGFEVAEWVFGHIRRLNTRIGHLKPGSADNTRSNT